MGFGETVTGLGRQGRERLWLWSIEAAQGAICSAWTEAEGSHFCYVLVLFCLDVRGLRASCVHWLKCSMNLAPV